MKIRRRVRKAHKCRSGGQRKILRDSERVSRKEVQVNVERETITQGTTTIEEGAFLQPAVQMEKERMVLPHEQSEEV